ncbi:DNA-binding protein, partial [Klebsiella pneumoniae]|uniref:DNA-binding protein n=1 Tax=Klebsiella pneumoniae TaxID=573 RepID=UPI0038537286
VQLMAAREGWNNSQVYCRKRAGRGGGLEYHINLLPTLARIEYERRYRAIERVEPKPAPELVLGNNLTERAACERDARIAILSAF